MKSIKDLKNIKGKFVLVRVDFNVPIKDEKVEDDFRIKKALPTIKFLQKKGARIILITHLGKGEISLLPVAKVLHKFIKIKFVPEITGPQVSEAVLKMQNGEILMLENLRNDQGEQEGNNFFAINLAKLADVYVNEAFPVSHRADTSIILLPKFLPHYIGFQFENEIKNLSSAFKKPKHPFLFILGGAKFSTKMPLIEKYLKLADYVFIAGALLDDFLKMEGLEVGQSLVDSGPYDLQKILKNNLPAGRQGKLILPVDVVVKNGTKLINKKVNEIEKDEIILDIGKQSIKMLELYIKKSKLILWNGPLGKYEEVGGGATKEVLKIVAKSKAESIIGGGDTVEIISEMKMENKFSFVSTGGGATLEFLAKGTLPGIKALK